jgi:hypothetical protein
MNRRNFIDGLPASYDYNYVVKTEKQCRLCSKTLTLEEIESNKVLCSENFDFLHKSCIESMGLEAVYSKPKDPTSMIRILRGKENESRTV